MSASGGNRYDHVAMCIDSRLYNGKITGVQMPQMLGFGAVGCGWRGTTTCFICKHKLEFQPVMECDYNCERCSERWRCRCGHDQTVRLQAAGVV